MIIWLNDAFGAGKTTTADELVALVPGSRLFDPETVGALLRANLTDYEMTDFQEWAPWGVLVVAAAAELTRFTGQHLVCPQTVLTRPLMDEILHGLGAAGLDVRHVLLDAEEDALRDRIDRSPCARQWLLDHLPEYQEARGWLRITADLVIDTSALSAPEVAAHIALQVPLALRARH